LTALEFTLLTCFIQKGLVTNVKQSHHTLQIDDGSNAMVEGVIQARHEAASTVEKWMRPNWRSTPTNEDLAEIEELIGEAYNVGRKGIAEAHKLVERIADAW